MNWASLVIMACWAALIVVWLIKKTSVKPTDERNRSPHRVVYSLPAAVGVSLILADLPYAPTRPTLGPTLWDMSPLVHPIGAILAVGGLILAIWARTILGTNWSARVVLKVDHELVMRGPYARLRHPIYSGILLMVAGTAIAAGTYGAIIGLIAVALGAWLKLRQEEALMLGQFPASYPAYRRRTYRLIPFLW